MTRADAIRELRELRASWQYAFACTTDCGRCDPRLQPVLDREAELVALIAGEGTGG